MAAGLGVALRGSVGVLCAEEACGAAAAARPAARPCARANTQTLASLWARPLAPRAVPREGLPQRGAQRAVAARSYEEVSSPAWSRRGLSGTGRAWLSCFFGRRSAASPRSPSRRSHGISTRQPRRRRDSSPRNIRVLAAAASRLVSTEYEFKNKIVFAASASTPLGGRKPSNLGFESLGARARAPRNRGNVRRLVHHLDVLLRLAELDLIHLLREAERAERLVRRRRRRREVDEEQRLAVAGQRLRRMVPKCSDPADDPRRGRGVAATRPRTSHVVNCVVQRGPRAGCSRNVSFESR